MLLVILVLGDPFGHPAHAQTADSSIDFAENRAVPVATFLAYDQDGDTLSWSLGGPDDDLFTIDDGVLAFREPPNYEDPQSATSGVSLAERNVYRVTVRAGGGTHDVAVTVTDVDEPGTASMDRRQPQVSRPLSASLSDEDEVVSAQRWQWSRSEDQTTWTDIEGATSPRRSPTQADEGMYIRATVTYSDKFGAGKTASAVSARRVEARTLSNAAPRFVDRRGDVVTTVTRTVAENTAVGRPVRWRVSATDTDGDLLFYELLDTIDLEDDDGVARFTIDSASGQVRVGKVLGADDGEREDEGPTPIAGAPAQPGDGGNSEYVLRVRVSDPSTASATVNVIVTVRDVTEPPAFGEDVPTLLRVKENEDRLGITIGDSGKSVVATTFAATDQDGDVVTVPHQVTGDDEEFLAFDRSTNILGFKADHKPDYEEKRTYSIAITARSSGRSTTLDVTIEVVDTEDDGEVSLSQRQPQVGREVSGIPSDPDGGMRIDRWVWEQSEIAVDQDGTPSAECRGEPGTAGVVGGWTPIDGATAATYTPELGDVGRCLRATVIYTDNIESPGDPPHLATGVLEAPTQQSRSANAAPRFVDQDLNSPGDQSDRTSRRVPENTDAGVGIGTEVSAMDDDDELLIYTLDGTDASFFSISRNTGQLMTKASLNYEARNSYSVVVTATDPSGASDSILVTINVTNVHDPVHITGPRSVRYPENGTEPVASFTAFDDAGHVIRWSLSGRDDDLFTIDDGVLSFREPPNYEDPQSGEDSNVYRVTVEAAGGRRSVTVTVTDVDEAGVASIGRPQPQVDRLLSASLSEEDAEVMDERWQWARSEDGRTWTDIEGSTEPQRRPSQADVGMYLRAAVTYSDKFGGGKTASAVSANPVEAKTLADSAPSFAGQDDDDATPYIDIARSVPENTAVGMPIGEPVSALDPDEDILFYELLETPDLRDTPDQEEDEGDPRFTIDSLTGQIRVGKVLGADPGATEDDADEREDEDSTGPALTGAPALPGNEVADNAGNSEYVLRVRVSDPSTASVTVNVIVTVTEVNEPPAFKDEAPTLLSVVENADPLVMKEGRSGPAIKDDTYEVTDQDGIVTGTDGYDDTTYTYSVSGVDGDDFVLGSSGKLTFKTGHEPDFEDRSSYSITVVAHSGEGARRLSATLDVIIDVVDGEDAGAVLLSQRQPEVGIAIHATTSDDDGGVTIRKWVWEWSDEFRVIDGVRECQDEDETPWTKIAEAESAVYIPKLADVGRCLRATAIYTDNIPNPPGAEDNEACVESEVEDDEACGVSEVPVGRHGSFDTAPASDGGFVNAAPVFPDQDFTTEGDQSDSTIREVPENSEKERSIGASVSAHDEDDDLLIYILSGPDAELFRIGRRDGQLKTEAPLNFEVRSSYSVVVTATDPFGATDSIVVNIEVTDEDDPAEITVNTG